MSRRPAFSDVELLRAIGPKRPATLNREARVRLLGEVAQALLDGRAPSREAALFVGGAVSGWLAEGGSLTKHYLKVDGRRGSHETASAIWRARHRDERNDSGDPV